MSEPAPTYTTTAAYHDRLQRKGAPAQLAELCELHDRVAQLEARITALERRLQPSGEEARE